MYTKPPCFWLVLQAWVHLQKCLVFLRQAPTVWEILCLWKPSPLLAQRDHFCKLTSYARRFHGECEGRAPELLKLCYEKRQIGFALLMWTVYPIFCLKILLCLSQIRIQLLTRSLCWTIYFGMGESKMMWFHCLVCSLGSARFWEQLVQRFEGLKSKAWIQRPGTRLRCTCAAPSEPWKYNTPQFASIMLKELVEEAHIMQAP